MTPEEALSLIAVAGCETSTSGLGSCYRYGRTLLHDPRGSYVSVCHPCFAHRVLVAHLEAVDNTPAVKP